MPRIIVEASAHEISQTGWIPSGTISIVDDKGRVSFIDPDLPYVEFNSKKDADDYFNASYEDQNWQVKVNGKETRLNKISNSKVTSREPYARLSIIERVALFVGALAILVFIFGYLPNL